MADEYTPHFDPAPRHVAFIPSDGYTETTEYELLGVPEGTVWKQTGEDTLRNKAQLFNGERDYVSQPLAVRLNNHTKETPPQPGENVIDFMVRVKFPDGSSELFPQQVKLTSDDAFYYNPTYVERITADPGQTVTMTPQNQFPLDLPTNAKWKVTGGDGWDWSVDQVTGTITAKVPTDSYNDANFEVVTVFEDGSERRTWTAIDNSGQGVELPEDPASQPEAPAPEAETGSSVAQKLSLIFGVLALLVGAVAFAWPQLQQFLPNM